MAEADPGILEGLELETADAGRKARRNKLLSIIGIAVLAALLIYGAWYFLVGSRTISTDNAYVGADTASVTPMVSGQVIEVAVADTQVVRKGDVLVRLDDSEARIALAQAEADLAKARRQFGQAAATSSALSAQVQARSAEEGRARAQLSAAQAEFAKASVDLDRRRKLAPGGAVSGDELSSATSAYAAARANLDLARAGISQAGAIRNAASSELAANNALISGTTAGSSPDVLAAQARLDLARLNLERTVVRAPIAGVITRRSVQTGQRVGSGAPLMLIVPVEQVYVDANFKEAQLRRLKIGQPVTLTSDLYGSGVEFHGKVVGMSGGTGSSFALIPAQNATGNWIKVVQRLPVRVALDPRELRAHPLRVGLSMEAVIDVSAQ
ncbi:HlyD family efflux transporter periplasmic adaptor subunit [Novosphingobium sp.]|uniref:HlyD family secretion protein n=1 Tax=Novosphingobium sp. TaxID=1874826 RepID=UPI00286E87B1|nr:HlyD family efflux transporter periplasmic adaptor subunit [Novosphingobium sp.]